jgi:hypothetical protein
MARRSEQTALLRALERQGWTVELRRSGHYRCLGPAGQIYFAASTPSDCRSLLNARAALRRLGADLPRA